MPGRVGSLFNTKIPRATVDFDLCILKLWQSKTLSNKIMVVNKYWVVISSFQFSSGNHQQLAFIYNLPFIYFPIHKNKKMKSKLI